MNRIRRWFRGPVKQSREKLAPLVTYAWITPILDNGDELPPVMSYLEAHGGGRLRYDAYVGKVDGTRTITACHVSWLGTECTIDICPSIKCPRNANVRIVGEISISLEGGCE